jgi:hypothetical protein
MDKSTQKLRESLSILIGVEEQGKNILSDLESQKETIKTVSDNMNKVNNDLTFSNKILNKMKSFFRF